MYTINNFEKKQIINNNIVSIKKFIKKIPPIKEKKNILKKENINPNDSKEKNNNNKNEYNISLKRISAFNNNIQRDNSYKPRINLNKIISNYQSKNMLKSSFDLTNDNNNNNVLLQKEIFSERRYGNAPSTATRQI